MELSKAQDILAHIVEQRVRWGKMYSPTDIGVEQLTEALIALSQGDATEVKDLRQSLATANRQLGAAKARETRYTKQIEGLKNEVATLTALSDDLADRLQGKSAGDSDGAAEDGERQD